jgi:hypothetical protein
MATWEYMIKSRRLYQVSGIDDAGNPIPPPELADLKGELDLAGANGWELISVVEHGGDLIGFFKRELP